MSVSVCVCVILYVHFLNKCNKSGLKTIFYLCISIDCRYLWAGQLFLIVPHTIMVRSIVISRPVLRWSWNYGPKINASDVSAPAPQSSCIGRCLRNAHARVYTHAHTRVRELMSRFWNTHVHEMCVGNDIDQSSSQLILLLWRSQFNFVFHFSWDRNKKYSMQIKKWKKVISKLIMYIQ